MLKYKYIQKKHDFQNPWQPVDCLEVPALAYYARYFNLYIYDRSPHYITIYEFGKTVHLWQLGQRVYEKAEEFIYAVS